MGATGQALRQAVAVRNTPLAIDADMSAGNGQVYESAAGVLGLVLLVGNRVDRLYVHPTHHSQGIGIALLSEVTRIALRSHARELVVLSWPSAVSYYESAGFSRVPSSVCTSDNTPDGGTPCIRLVKRLAVG